MLSSLRWTDISISAALAGLFGGLVVLPAVASAQSSVVVTSERPLWKDSELPRVATTPTLVFDGRARAAGGVPLESVTGAIRLVDGTIVIADAGHSRVVFVGSSGAIQRSIGSRGIGESPGQFNYIASLFKLPGAKIGAYDGATSRLTVLDARGKLLRWDYINPAPVVNRAGLKGRWAMRILGSIQGRTLIATQSSNMIPYPMGVRSDSAAVVAIASNGKWRELARVLKGAYYVFRDGKGSSSGLVPFGREGSVAVGNDAWYYTDGREFEVKQHDGTGNVVRRLQARRATLPVGVEEIRRFGELRVARSDASSRMGLLGALKWMSYPTTRPAYTALQVDELGFLWARNWGFDDELPRWDIFDKGGKWLGTVELPAVSEVFEIGRTYLLARVDARDETQSVHLYHLKR